MSFTNRVHSTDSGAQPEEPALPLHREAVLLAVGVGTLLSAMSGSAINLALPALGREFQISIDSSRWVVQAFLLAVAVLLLVMGRLSDLVGHRRIYLVGFTLVGAAALACALAPTFIALVGFRLLQGIGGAMVMASSPALLTTSFPAAQRGRVLGIQATATYIGLTAGPPLGGFVIAWLGWRWIFHLMVPISLVILALGWWSLPKPSGKEQRSRFDWPGVITLTLGLPLLFIVLNEGSVWSWSDWRLWSSSGFGLLFLFAFVLLERSSSRPLLDLSLFRSVTFSGAVLSAIANYISLFVVLLLLPFYLEEHLNLNATGSGTVLAVQSLVMALVASPSGWLSDRIGSRGLAVAGLSILAFGMLGLSFCADRCGRLGVALWLAVMGFGTGVFISPNSSALMGSAGRQQQGVAAGVLAEARILGMLLGVTLGSAVFQAAGGRTGGVWRIEDLTALKYVLWSATAVASAGAAIAGLGSKRV
ncbi:MAG: MFS transporter [Deltaproteobacteria bacterium]|nr:MFS transporter [Deltaproteobacteria bacterium]